MTPRRRGRGEEKTGQKALLPLAKTEEGSPRPSPGAGKGWRILGLLVCCWPTCLSGFELCFEVTGRRIRNRIRPRNK